MQLFGSWSPENAISSYPFYKSKNLKIDAEILTDKCTKNPSMVTDRIRSLCLIRFFFINNMTCEALIAQDDTRRTWAIGLTFTDLHLQSFLGYSDSEESTSEIVKFMIVKISRCI